MSSSIIRQSTFISNTTCYFSIFTNTNKRFFNSSTMINYSKEEVEHFFVAVNKRHANVNKDKHLTHFETIDDLKEKMTGQYGKKIGMTVKERKKVMQYLAKFRQGLFVPSSNNNNKQESD